jgi:triacylglycerol lipase
VAFSVYVTWCNMIAFFGGTIPLIGWELEGGFLTGVLWALFVSGTIASLARTALRYLLKAIGTVIPLTVASAPHNTPGAASTDGAPVLPMPDGVGDGYNSGFASLCAVASSLVYQPDDTVKGTLGPLKAGGLSLIVEQNHRCLLIAYSDCIIVAFRGTDAGELADWKTNVKHTPAPGAFGLAHSGYLAAVDLLWPRLMASLEPMRDNQQTLLLTGHSMGGALAVVAASRFAAEGAIPVTGLYTFGQPAVADAVFHRELATRVEGRYFRFVNSSDMVPGLAVDPSFSPGGQQLFIDREGRIHTGDALMPMLSTRLLTQVLEAESRSAEVGDHGIGEYVRVLTSSGPGTPRAPGLRGLTTREMIHHGIGAALYAVMFVWLCIRTWRTDGTEAFAMGSGAVFVLLILAFMFVWPQEYNVSLLHWYTRQGLTKLPGSTRD